MMEAGQLMVMCTEGIAMLMRNKWAMWGGCCEGVMVLACIGILIERRQVMMMVMVYVRALRRQWGL